MIWLVARHELRARWRQLVLLAVIIALWGAGTMTAVSGARRVSSVVDRFQRATSASDATFWIGDDRDGTQLAQALARRPDVVVSDTVWSASTGLAWDQKTWVQLVGGESGRWSSTLDRALVLHGRRADPARADEVVVAESTAHLLGAGVGDRLAVPTWDRATWYAWLPTRGGYPPFDGPQIEVQIVGVVRISSELSASSGSEDFVLVTPAFVERWRDAVGDNPRLVVVSFRPGTNPNVVADEVSADLGRVVSMATTDDEYAGHLRKAAEALRAAMLGLAAVTLCVGAFVVVLAIGRAGRASSARQSPLAALGATPRQRAIALSAPIGGVGVLAAGSASAVAAWASRWVSFGPTGKADPHRGMWLDATVLVGGAVFVVVVVLVAAALSTVANRSIVADGGQLGRSRAYGVGWLGRLGPAAMIGRINVLGSSARRLSIVAGSVTIAGLVAASWYALSLHALGAAPERWGYTWSSSPEATFDAESYTPALDATLADPDIAGVGTLVSDTALIEGQPVSVSTFLTYGGSPTEPARLAGRVPEHLGEIALGRRTAAQLGVGVGDSVRVASALRPATDWEVVGVIVPPLLPNSNYPGDGAYVVPADHLDLFGDRPSGNYLMLSYRDDADVNDLEARLAMQPGWRFERRSHPRQPGAVANITDLGVLLPWLGGFFAVLGVGATVLMATRVGMSHERVVRILRALGFTPRDVRRAIATEAAIIGCAGLTFGLAAGVLAARLVWRLTVFDLGVVAVQPSPLVTVFVTAGVTLVVLAAAILIGSSRVNTAAIRRRSVGE